jgi:outer membrane protein assembly factor BamB
MLRVLVVSLAAAVGAVLLAGADWPMQNGNPQRNGWAKSEHLITKENVARLELLYKYKVEGQAPGPYSLTTPIVDGNLITYRGFKEMLIFGSWSGSVFSVDADLNKPIWEAHLSSKDDKEQSQNLASVCPGGLTAPVVMEGSSASSMRFALRASRTPAGAAAPRRRSPYFPPLSQTLYPLRPTTLSELAAIYAVSADGRLHIINSSTGDDLIPSIKFVQPGAKVTSLNIHENLVFATTADHCDGFRNALYAVDLLNTTHQGALFPLRFGGFAGSAGTAIGSDGTVYLQSAYGEGDSLRNYHEAILALNPRDLRVKDYFLTSEKPVKERDLGRRGITPMVFLWGGRDIITAAGRDGRIYLLDSRTLGGPDHKTPLFRTDVIATAEKNYDGNGFQGAFSSWYDVDSQNRWIYAPLSGPLSSSAHLPLAGSPPASGSIVAFQLGGQQAKPNLQPLWVSRDVSSPGPVVIGNGMVFALTTGLPASRAKKDGSPYSFSELQSITHPAQLHALDALTGKELYSSGGAISGFARPGALAVANGRIYLTSQDNNVYCFGFLKSQPQLSEQ